MHKQINIFYVYAQEDRPLRDKLEQHLSILQQEKIITSWSDRCILPGKTWANEISTHLEQADIILLLVSAAFLSSKYCYSVEMAKALEKEKNGSTHVIPVILRHIDWQGAPFSHLQALPTLAKPVVGGGWRSQDEAFTDIAQGIRKVVEKLSSRTNDVVRPKSMELGKESSVEDLHMRESSSHQKLDLRTDILLITVTAIEAQAVLNLFAKEIGQKFERHFIDDKTYFNLGVLNGVRIMMVQSEMGASGPGGALLVVDEGIRVLSPSAVIMVGIAFGIDSYKQQIGDILVSQQLLGYELQRIATSNKGKIEVIPRGDRSHASTMLLDRFRGGMLDWHESKVECGLILSGDKLIDQQDFRDQLRKLAPDAIGGEMEGTGLYSAAQRRKVDWILVKAICDWADGNKGQEKDQDQQMAAEKAVQFTLHVLKLGGFIPGISTSSGNGGQFISETNSTEAGTAVSSDSGATPFEPNNVGATTINKQSSSPPLKCGTLLRKYDNHASWVGTVAWEPGGTRIVSTGGDGTVRVWNNETGKSLYTYRGHTHWLNKANVQAPVYAVAWDPKGEFIASAYGTNVHVWNAKTEQKRPRYQEHSGLLPDIFAIAWSPDGKRIASVCSSIGLDKTVHLWNAFTGQSLSRYPVRSGLIPTNFCVFSLAWSPDGTRIAAACDDKVIRVWNTETERLVSTYPCSGSASHVAWSPDSLYLASAHTDRAQIWDTFTGKVVTTYHEHTDHVRCVAWSPDGALLATASDDRTVHIWEPLTGKRKYIYRGHSNWTTSVAWSPDGTRIASASNDQTVHIWQAKINK